MAARNIKTTTLDDGTEIRWEYEPAPKSLLCRMGIHKSKVENEYGGIMYMRCKRCEFRAAWIIDHEHSHMIPDYQWLRTGVFLHKDRPRRPEDPPPPPKRS